MGKGGKVGKWRKDGKGPGGNCPQMGTVRVGNIRVEIALYGNFPGGKHPGGNCPDGKRPAPLHDMNKILVPSKTSFHTL